MRYTHNPWGHNVSLTISRSQGKRSMSHGSFEIFVVSAPLLPPYLNKSLHMWHACIQDMRGQWVMDHCQDERSKGNVTGVISSFGPLHSVAFSLFDWITSYVAYIQHMRWQCVMHHFQFQRSRSHRSFQVLSLSAPWLHPYFTGSLYMWHFRYFRYFPHFLIYWVSEDWLAGPFIWNYSSHFMLWHRPI